MKVGKKWRLDILPVLVWRDKQFSRMNFNLLGYKGELPLEEHLTNEFQNGTTIFAFVKNRKVIGLYLLERESLSLLSHSFTEENAENYIYHKITVGNPSKYIIKEYYETDALLKAFPNHTQKSLILLYLQTRDRDALGLEWDDRMLICTRRVPEIVGSISLGLGFSLMLLTEFISGYFGIEPLTGFFDNLLAAFIAGIIVFVFIFLFSKQFYVDKE